MIYVIATIKAVSGQSRALVAGAQACIEATRKEDGCVSYDYVQDTADADTLMVVERWSSRAALDAHMQAPHLALWRQQRKPMVLSTRIEIIDAASVDII